MGDAFSAANKTPQVGGDCYDKLYSPLYDVLELYSKGQEKWRKCLEREGFECNQSKAGDKELTRGSAELYDLREYWSAGPA